MIVKTGWYVQHKNVHNGKMTLVSFSDEDLARAFANMVNGRVNSIPLKVKKGSK